MLFLLRGRIFFSAAEFFGLWGRIIWKRVGNTDFVYSNNRHDGNHAMACRVSTPLLHDTISLVTLLG
jgi:hypothetical protein